MDSKKYILPIEATTLAHFYSRACIVPVSCLKKGHHDTIQSVYPNALLLTEHYGVKGSNCYIVVRIAEEELKSEYVLPIAEKFILYYGALPISRIDEIVFNSAEQKDTTITNIEMGNAFVRGCRISVGSAFEQVSIPQCDASGKDTNIADLKIKLKEYDRIMGGLMFMRLAKEQPTTYSDNFLQTFALFSPYMAEQLKSLGIDDTTKYKTFFEEKNKRFREILQNYISEDIVCDYARKYKINHYMDPINGYDFKILSKNPEVYILALLQNFSLADGEGGKDKIDDLILNGFYHRSFIIQGRAESFAFYYGYNRGYDKFRNQYTLGNKSVQVKYYFNSLFEKFISEEVFSYTVNSSKQYDFSVIGVDMQSFDSKKINADEYSILGTTIVVKKKWEQNPKAENKVSGVHYGDSLENKNYVDIRCAKFLALTLKTNGQRKKIAQLAGLSKTESKPYSEEEIVDFLLQLSFEQMEELYKYETERKRRKCNGNKKINEANKVGAAETEDQEPNLFAEHA